MSGKKGSPHGSRWSDTKEWIVAYNGKRIKTDMIGLLKLLNAGKHVHVLMTTDSQNSIFLED